MCHDLRRDGRSGQGKEGRRLDVIRLAGRAGMPPALHLPRLDTPRTAVPAGSVAVAEEYTGVYPRRSPGGWRLLGRTDLTLWDERRSPPALLAPGARVTFVAR